MKQMWLFLVLCLCSLARAHKCCSTCACAARCEAPHITASLDTDGLHIDCPNADCGCVTDELDTCTYGDMWRNSSVFRWEDPRWLKCIRVESFEPLSARATIRWWHNKCMGHVQLHLDISLENIHRDLYMDFNVPTFFEHDHIHNVFRIKTMSGSLDKRPMAGSSTMFFDAYLLQNVTGVHVEITSCVVQILEGKAIDANILNEYDVYNPSNLVHLDNGMRMTYTAFWDGQTNSPFQRLVCDYGLFNGTASQYILHQSVNRTYMMADPNEQGVLINDCDSVITGVL